MEDMREKVDGIPTYFCSARKYKIFSKAFIHEQWLCLNDDGELHNPHICSCYNQKNGECNCKTFPKDF